MWIADWTHDTGEGCTEAGWVHVDNHILNDGVSYWHIETGFTTTTGMTGQSAAVGYHNNNCCEIIDGYDNDWYQAIRMTYTGAATISYDYIVDSEAGYDFLQIETDPLCQSFDRVDFSVDPSASAARFRTLEAQADGLIANGEVVNQALTNYGAGTHCVYVAFFADGGFSPCDGFLQTSIGEGAVVDNIVIVDASGTRSEDFEDGTLDIGTFLNIADSVPFGTWARLYQHITDNGFCTENTTCAWLWTDHTTPTLYNHASMSFAPGGYVIRNWLDDIVVSPWVSLASTPAANGTVLQFRRFPGNFFTNSRIVQNWSVRGKGSINMQACVSGWGHAFQWNSLSFFAWQSLIFDMSPHFDPTVEAIQPPPHLGLAVARRLRRAPSFRYWSRSLHGPHPHRAAHSDGSRVVDGDRYALAGAGLLPDRDPSRRDACRRAPPSHDRPLRNLRLQRGHGSDTPRLHHPPGHGRLDLGASPRPAPRRGDRYLRAVLCCARAWTAQRQVSGTVRRGGQWLLLLRCRQRPLGAYRCRLPRVLQRGLRRHLLPRRRRAAVLLGRYRCRRRLHVQPDRPLGHARLGGSGAVGDRRSTRGQLPAHDQLGSGLPGPHRGKPTWRPRSDGARARRLEPKELHPLRQPYHQRPAWR